MSIARDEHADPNQAALVHETRPWGSFTVIHTGDRYQVKLISVEPGEQLSLQYHQRRSEYWVVATGRAVIVIGDEEREIGEKQGAFVPQGTRHRISNPGPGPLDIIEVQFGDYFGEDDIVRFADRYGRV